MENKKTVVVFENENFNLQIKDDGIEIDIEELSKAVGYSDNRALKLLIQNNPELQSPEFSRLKKVRNLENGIYKMREKRFFNEQGLYEVTFLANTEKAKRFRRFVRELLTKIRKKQLMITNQVNPAIDNKLDSMMTLLTQRDEEISDLLEFFETAKTKLDKIDTMEQDIKDIKETCNEIIDTVNKLIDKVYKEEEEEDCEW